MTTGPTEAGISEDNRRPRAGTPAPPPGGGTVYGTNFDNQLEDTVTLLGDSVWADTQTWTKTAAHTWTAGRRRARHATLACYADYRPLVVDGQPATAGAAAETALTETAATVAAAWCALPADLVRRHTNLADAVTELADRNRRTAAGIAGQPYTDGAAAASRPQL